MYRRRTYMTILCLNSGQSKVNVSYSPPSPQTFEPNLWFYKKDKIHSISQNWAWVNFKILIIMIIFPRKPTYTIFGFSKLASMGSYINKCVYSEFRLPRFIKFFIFNKKTSCTHGRSLYIESSTNYTVLWTWQYQCPDTSFCLLFCIP